MFNSITPLWSISRALPTSSMFSTCYFSPDGEAQLHSLNTSVRAIRRFCVEGANRAHGPLQGSGFSASAYLILFGSSRTELFVTRGATLCTVCAFVFSISTDSKSMPKDSTGTSQLLRTLGAKSALSSIVGLLVQQLQQLPCQRGILPRYCAYPFTLELSSLSPPFQETMCTKHCSM